AVAVPVVATGGIADARGIAAALTLGASAVQIGTGFLRCPEAGIHPAWAEAIGRTLPEDTVVSRVFSGRAGRSIATGYVLAATAPEAPAPAPYPVQRGLTAPIRRPRWPPGCGPGRGSCCRERRAAAAPLRAEQLRARRPPRPGRSRARPPTGEGRLRARAAEIAGVHGPEPARPRAGAADAARPPHRGAGDPRLHRRTGARGRAGARRSFRGGAAGFVQRFPLLDPPRQLRPPLPPLPLGRRRALPRAPVAPGRCRLCAAVRPDRAVPLQGPLGDGRAVHRRRSLPVPDDALAGAHRPGRRRLSAHPRAFRADGAASRGAPGSPLPPAGIARRRRPPCASAAAAPATNRCRKQHFSLRGPAESSLRAPGRRRSNNGRPTGTERPRCPCQKSCPQARGSSCSTGTRPWSTPWTRCTTRWTR